MTARATFEIDLRNQGSVEAPAGAILCVSGFDDANVVVVAEQTLTAALPAGEHVEIGITADLAPFASGWIVDVTALDEDDCDRVHDRADGRL